MEATSNQASARETEATLQLNRSLLPIDEYAVRKGVSRDIIEEYGRQGLVQIRRHSGKIFVVDVPVSPYRCPPEDAEGTTNTGDNNQVLKKISTLGQKATSKDAAPQKNRETVTQDSSKAAETDAKPNGEAIGAGTISALVEKMCNRASQITGKPLERLYAENSQVEGVPAAPVVRPRTGGGTPDSAQPKSVSAKKEGSSQLSGRIFCAVSQIFNKLKGRSGGRVAQAKLRRGIQDYRSLPSDTSSGKLSEKPQVFKPAAQVGSKRAWQVIASIAILSLLTALIANVWLYRDRRTHLADLDQAYTSIQTVYSDYVKADRQVTSLENELTESKAEIQRIQDELDTSRVEAETARDQLTEARRNLKAVQLRHAQALGGLNKEIRRLAAWLKKPNADLQPIPGSDDSDQ
ncbi:MAG: hypothetical protein ACYS8I_03595 [Planctomycetota bacterium]|jgi:hypothetical protein